MTIGKTRPILVFVPDVLFLVHFYPTMKFQFQIFRRSRTQFRLTSFLKKKFFNLIIFAIIAIFAIHFTTLVGTLSVKSAFLVLSFKMQQFESVSQNQSRNFDLSLDVLFLIQTFSTTIVHFGTKFLSGSRKRMVHHGDIDTTRAWVKFDFDIFLR